MTVKLETSIQRYIGDTADTKPTSVPVGSTFLDRETDILYITYDGTNWVARDTLVRLMANSGVDIGDVDVLSIAAGDNNIGNVDIVTLPAGNLGQQAKAASLSVAPATDITDATYIGDIKFGEALPAGTALLGLVRLATATGAEVTEDTSDTVMISWGAQGSGADGTANVINRVRSSAGDLTTLLGAGNFGLNPSSTWDRLRSIAASGAGLGVQQVGTLGELITLAASAARTSDANGTAVTGLGWRNRYIILFDLTVADTDAGDTLDVYVDVSLDGNTWLNALHFTQIIGTDAASKRYAVLDPSAPGTAEILVTADAAAGVVRPSMFGPQMRARWAIVDAGTDDASFTFSVTAYAI